MINKRDISRSRTPTDTELKYQLSAIPNKVDKEKGKGLSTNDFSDNYKQDIDNNTKARHHHNNISVLNNITQQTLDNLNRIVSEQQMYILFSGNGKQIELNDDPVNYDALIIEYGNVMYSDVKWVFPTKNMQFYISLDINLNSEEKSLCSISGTALKSENLNISKVVAFKFKKGVG